MYLVSPLQGTGRFFSAPRSSCGALNVALRPVLLILTLPFLLVTLGFFLFVLNAVMLLLRSAVSDALGLGFHVEGFWSAFLGALVVSVVSFVLTLFVGSETRHTGRT